MRADGDVQWMAVTEHQVHVVDGDFRVLALRDIGDAVKAQVEHAIGHDPLTGEALVRWVRPDGTTVEPGAFLPVAEHRMLITDIDLDILRRSIDALSTLPSHLSIAVNVSAASFARADYADQAMELLRTSGIDATRLHLEVTETAVLHVTDRYAPPCSVSPMPGPAGSWTTSARATPRSGTCATFPSRG